MAERVRDGAEMVRQMSPRHEPGRFVFRTLPAEIGTEALAEARAVFREAEGVSVIRAAGPGDADAFCQITLDVHSALDGVGLTAAVSGALADAGIPVNVVAANHHDHVFVPEEQTQAALDVLHALSRGEGPQDVKE